MHSKRFAESSCLKCHHQVTELAAEPEASRSACAEADEGLPAHPGLRLLRLPRDQRLRRADEAHRSRFAKRAELLRRGGAVAGRSGLEGAWRRGQLRWLRAGDVDRPKTTQRAAAAARARGHRREAGRRSRHAEDQGPSEGRGTAAAEALGRFRTRWRRLLRDVEAPGDLRKVGPSLRHVAAKNSFEFLYDWIEDPHRFRPSTKMPRFFGLHDHLDGDGLAVAKEFEPIEVRAISEYLLAASQPFEYLKPADGAEGSAERGKKVFEMRGCLACHSHADFPPGKATHGPDLSRIGAKLATSRDGKKWLYSWVREPNRYHSRTVMPNTFLEPDRRTRRATRPIRRSM